MRFRWEEIRLPAKLRASGVVLLAFTSAVGASAQKPQDAGALKADLVRTGLYIFYGGGGNSLLRLTGNGLIVVDGKLPGSYGALMKAVNRIAEQRVRVLINTDHHVEHTGNNAQFLQAGVQILAQENVKNNLAAYDPPGGRIAPPTKTYDREFTLQGGGIEVQLLHLSNAATSGDTVVYFKDLKVVALGDLYAPTPVPDYAAGGSLVGWGPVLDAILKLDFDIAVPGAGPLITRADLALYRAKIGTLVSRATSLVREGVPKDRLMSRLKTDDLGWQFDFTGSQLDLFYADLSLSK